MKYFQQGSFFMQENRSDAESWPPKHAGHDRFLNVSVLVLGAHLAGLRAGQTARQRSTVGRQSGGERWAAVCQHGFKVTARLLRLLDTGVHQSVKSVFYILMEEPTWK